METGTKLYTDYEYGAEKLPYDLTYNVHDGRIYGIFSNSKNTGIVLSRITYEKGKNSIVPIKELEGNWVALASDANGQLYGISSVSDGATTEGVPVITSSSLYKIDSNTGETTLIGETGQKPLLSGSATIDIRSGRMFWTVAPDAVSSYLCEVDLTTGAATKLFDFEGNRQITGMYAVTPLAEDGAPAEVTDVNSNFEGGSLSGTISFKSPTTLYDGTAASGSLNYSITCEGEDIASGTTTFGADNNVNVTVDKSGNYTFTIHVSNSVGKSPKVNYEKYIGYGTPKSPENIKALNANDKITVSWDAVTEAADAGYLNPSEIRYTVTRIPDNTVIASAITGTSATIDADNNSPLQSFRFEVKADNNGQASAAGTSNNVVTGLAALPWSEPFDSEDAVAFFNIIDSNNDGKTWGFYTDRMRIPYGAVAMNDWLISPPMQLEANSSYRFSFKVRASNSNYPERIEAKCGLDNTAEGMTISIIDPTDITSGEYITLEGFINPTQSGKYYIGLHGISDANQFNLEIDDICVNAGENTAAPGESVEFSIVPDNTGLHKASISFKAPTATIGGETLTAIEKIVVTRGETELKVFNNPTPGETLTCTDETAKAGVNTYAVTAYNEAGKGRTVTAEAFIGTPLAAMPEDVLMTEPEYGKVNLTWTPVDKSAEGKAINPERVLYRIYDLSNIYSSVLIADNIQGTTYAFDAVSDDSQKLVRYAVSAVTDGGESEQAKTEIAAVGHPYTDYAESFAGGEASTLYAAENLNYGNWAPATDGDGVTAQDGDGGFMAMNAYFAGYNGAFKTGKISLANLNAPILSFYTYNPDNERADQNIIEVSVSTDGREWTSVFNSTVVRIGEEKGWHEVIVPLNEYTGKDIRLKFFAETFSRPYVTTYIDNIKVIQQDPVEMQVSSVEAPTHVRTGDAFTLNVNVMNNGSGTASGYKVEIYEGDTLCAVSEDNAALSAMESANIPFNLTMSPFKENGSLTYKAIVSHPDDSRDDNNEDEIEIVAVASNNPAPENLQGNIRQGAVELSWEAPVLASEAPEAVTDGFENATAWAHAAPDWVFIDRDKAPVVAFGEVEFPGVTAGQTTSAFITFSATGIFEGNTYLMPHGGEQYLVSLARYDAGAIDDWAISPELSGDAQTVSFFAKSYHNTYPERIEAYYSTGSFDPKDFVSAGLTVETVPGNWTEYSVNLPQGARYFAIRSCGSDTFMLMLDDVTYKPASSHNIELIGYNVYRDNEKINDEPVSVPAYTDNVDHIDEHSWVVTAVYDRGESNASNRLSNVGLGVEGISDDYRIAAYDGTIFVSGVEGRHVTIVTTDGKSAFNSVARSSLAVEVTPGVYIVTVDGRATKILVK